ncbi:hypothetical protein D3C72_1228090 [compost metagenome]
MNPVLGNAVTSAPKALLFQSSPPLRENQTQPPTIKSCTSMYSSSVGIFINCANGSDEPALYSMHGSAKNSTKAFTPAMAGSGNMPRRVAR